MENAGEDDCSDENRRVVERIKNAIDDIKQLNGLVECKDTANLTKRNGQIHSALITKEQGIRELEQEKCEDNNGHIGNGDRCSSPEKVSENVELAKTEIQAEVQKPEFLQELDIDESSEEKCSVSKCETEELVAENASKVSHSDKSDINEIYASNQTPVKQECVGKEKFILNDKIRNSLKDLTNKVKSTPEKREPDKNNMSEGSTPEHEPDIVEIPSSAQDKDPVCASDKGNLKKSESFESEKDIADVEVDDDAVLLDKSSDGTPMEIASEDEGNEDDLLEITTEPEKDLKQKCNNIKTDVSIFHDKVQFDEDSNSNSNSGNINEIVNFLSNDLSNAKSPLTVDNVKDKKKDEDQNHITIIDDDSPTKPKPIDEDDDMLDSKDTKTSCSTSDKNGDVSIDVSSPKTNTDNNDSSSKTLVTDTPISVKNDSEDDDVIICESQSKEDVGSQSKMQIKKDEQDKHEAKTETADKMETCLEDDDVIFEKEVKPSNEAKPSDNSNCKKLDCDTKLTASEPSISNEPKDNILDHKPAQDDKTPSLTQETMAENSSSLDKSDVAATQSVERKRAAESDSDVSEAESKRSRLDLSGLIGKLGSRVQPTSIELTDSEEETESGSHVTEKESLDSDEMELKKEDSDTDSKKYTRITEKELEDLVREKVKAYLTTQRETLIVQLSQKVKDLQESNDLWKRQVKDLQSKVNEVTVLQQNLEQRKAKTDALRQITKRSVGLQVEDGRTWSGHHYSLIKERLNSKLNTQSKSPVSSNPKTAGKPSPKQEAKSSPTSTKPPVLHTTTPIVTAPPGSNGTIRLPIPQTSQPMLTQQSLIPPSQLGTTFKAPSVKSLLDTTRVQPTVSSGLTPPTTTPASVINLVQLPQRLITQSNVTQGYITISQAGISPSVTKVVSKSTGTRSVIPTTIDLTDDDDSSKTRVVTLPPGVTPVSAQMAGVRHMIAPGTQIIRSAIPNAQTQYQLVFNSQSPALRPATVMTGPGINSLPQSGTIIQTIPQSNVVTLTSPTALTPGTTMTRISAPLVRFPTQVQPPPAPPTQPEPVQTHPAPFPPLPNNQSMVRLPPKPTLKISRVSQGIVLSWNMTLQDSQSEISSYQLFAYQETSAAPSTNLWKKVGDVKALPLPMACTLTQFQVGHKYHFAVRAMDSSSKVGNFSDPSSIYLKALPPTSTA